MASQAPWRRGDTIMHRHVGHGDGRVIGWPHIVVEDRPGRTVLYQPEGAPFLIWNLGEQRFEPQLTVRMYALRIVCPHRPYYVSLWFEAETGIPPWWQPHFGADYEGRFRGWKVDVVTPVQRTEHGYDSVDQLLDTMVRPDRSYYWKDMEQLASMVSKGFYSMEEAEEIRLAGEEVVPLIEAGKSPFDDSWTDWWPTADLVLGYIPDGWQF